jgi:putative redox protein
MEISERNKVSAIIRNETYRTELSALGHQLVADEPEANGGKNLGIGPGYFVRAGLASCTAITLRMYANRKGYSVDEILVDIFTEEVDGKTVFHREIGIKGTLDEAERTRMLQIANKCPVHKMLSNAIEIETKLEMKA